MSTKQKLFELASKYDLTAFGRFQSLRRNLDSGEITQAEYDAAIIEIRVIRRIGCKLQKYSRLFK